MRQSLSFWVALGIIATSATQLRVPGIPIGPGEVLLLGWMFCIVLLLLRGESFVTGRIFWVIVIYWMISAVLLGLGTIVALTTNRLDTDNAVHDAFAFAFMALLSSLFSLSLFGGRQDTYYASIARYAFAIFAIIAGSLLLVAMFLPSLGPLKFWWGAGTRFLGWAKNPNQLALYALGMPFLGGYLLQRARRAWHKVAYGIGIVCCLLVGLATLSDALKLSWIVGLGTAAALAWWRTVPRMRGRLVYVTHLLIPFLVTFFLAALGQDIFLRAWELGEATYEERGQGEDRIILWTHGLEALSHSPMVGLGPGAHSGHYGPFQSFEAHNALIDWGTSAGLPGMLLHIGLVIWCARQAWRAGSSILFSMVISLTVFGIFGYTLRQPIYWVLLIFSVRLSQPTVGSMVKANKHLDAHKMKIFPANRAGQASLGSLEQGSP